MKRNLLLTSLLLLFVVTVSFSQDTSSYRKNIIGKWYPEKYLETDGKIYPVSKDEAGQYIWYKSDGSMESIEDDVNYVGRWTMNASKKIIVFTQTQSKDYPQKMESKLVKLTETELVMKSKDAGGDWITIYFKKRQ